MPLMRCRENEKPGWKFGEEGKCYTYQPGNEESENEAKQKAINQGIAMGEIPTDTDIDDDCLDCGGGENNNLKRVERYEQAEILDYTEDEEDGFLTVELAATRTGVMPYLDNMTGEVVMELKPPDEIFSEETMNSLKGVPITDTHPPVMVDSKNWIDFTKGTTHLDVKKESNLLVVSETLFDDNLIAYVKSGKKAQVSIGFRADLEDESGEFEGKEYDRIQRNIRINHVAHTEQGRAGEEVRARLDSLDSDYSKIGYSINNENNENKKEGEDDMPDELTMENLAEFTFDDGSNGLEDYGFEFVDPVWVEKDKLDDFKNNWENITIEENKEDEVELEEIEIGDETIKVVKEDAEELKKALDNMKGKLDSKEDEVGKLEERVDELEDRDIDAIVQDRLDLIDTARKYVQNFDASGKSVKDIKVEVIQKLDEDFDPEGKSDEYISARFDGAISTLDKIKADSYGDNNLFTKKQNKNDELSKKRKARKSLKANK